VHSSKPFATSALEGCRWSAQRPGRFTPGKEPVPVVHADMPVQAERDGGGIALSHSQLLRWRGVGGQHHSLGT